MRWSFTLPGQPISWNAAYRIGKKTGRRGSYLSLVKTDAAAAWQEGAVLIIRAAKPSGWSPDGFVRLIIRVYLQRDMDADNVGKLLNDAFQRATGLDDRHILTCFASKVSGLSAREAKLEVVVDDDHACRDTVLVESQGR